jgi:hypothetical protein
MAQAVLALLLANVLAASIDAAALRRAAIRNVPKGECYECEVTCFEDCLLKYDREIIQEDLKDAKDREKAKRKAAKAKGKASLLQLEEASTNRTRVFSWRTRGGPTRSEEVNAMIGSFQKCLENEKCTGHRATKWQSSLPWATKARKNPACVKPSGKTGKAGALLDTSSSQCSKPSDTCSSRTCVAKGLEVMNHTENGTALVQSKHIPLHPVKVNTFAKGQQGIEACFKSCLAATCGCQDAPGFDVIAKMAAQIKANDANGDPVEDTPPEYNYRPAMKDECAGGAAGIKINKGLYTGLAAGWLEVCTEDFLKNMMVADTAKGMKKCQSGAPEDVEYGCIWNDKKGACVWGLKPVARCSVRFMSDKK